MWHCLEGLLFSLTPEEYCTRVVSSAHMSIYAQEEHCTWVVSSVLDTLCPGCLCSPGLQILADLMMFITGKMISIISMMVSIIALLFVQKSRTILTLSWTLSKNEVICWLVIFSISQLCVTRIQNHDMIHSYVTLPFLFCRNHTIWRMPRVWHQPSQVGKTYEWFHCWNCAGSSETVSDCQSVTVATLCWGFGTQQSLIFCCLHWDITTVVTPPSLFFLSRGSYSSM